MTDDAGAASAVFNASQQVGGSIGTALLNTLAVSATTAYIGDNLVPNRPPDPLLQARVTVDGFVTAVAWGVVLLLGSALVSLFLIKASKRDLADTLKADTLKADTPKAGAGSHVIRPPTTHPPTRSAARCLGRRAARLPQRRQPVGRTATPFRKLLPLPSGL